MPWAAGLRIALALFLVATARSVTLESARVRVEASVRDGRLEERYFGRDGDEWVQVGSVQGLAAASVKKERGALVERVTVEGVPATRTVSLDGTGPWLRVTTRLEPAVPVEIESFSERLRFEGRAAWAYSPSVGGYNPDAQYKAPLILVQEGRKALGIVPDVLALTREQLRTVNHAIDLDVPAGPLLTAGYIPGKRKYHSVYERDAGRRWSAAAGMENSYYVLVDAHAAPGEAYREAVRFLWSAFGRPAQRRAAAQQSGTGERHRSCGLWDDWRREVWDRESREQWLSFRLPDGSSGGAAGTIRWGQPRPSVYLSAWFNSLRTAYGMALHARRAGKPDLLEFARQTLNAALDAPGRDGAFRTIALPLHDGRVLWAAGDGAGKSTEAGYLGFDMSWTGYWLLRWRAAGLAGSEAVLPRCAALARFLMARQQEDGMIPTRFDEEGAVEREKAKTVMAETGPAALFLLELYHHDRRPEYLQAAGRGLAFLEREVVPERKWYDFETFWSCSPRGISFDERTRQYPANNLALIHAVAAYLAMHRATGDARWLARGEALLDYLLLYQQVWTNPVLEDLSGDTMLLGGFTTQNSDAEWSDARQSLCANVLLDYYRATGKPEYLERGVAALRAQFPVSPAENWAHVGYGKKAGVSSFHWGTGSGMAGVEIEEDFLRDGVVDIPGRAGVGVNGLNITETSVSSGRIALRVASPYGWSRSPVIVFRGAEPGRRYRLQVNGRAAGEFTGAELARGILISL